MKRIAFAILVCALLLASCGGDKDKVADGTQTGDTAPAVTQSGHTEKDMKSLAAEAVSKITFSIELEELSADSAAYLYPGLPEGTECVIYSTGGAGAEELAVFRTGNVAELLKVIEDHREAQVAAYASYKPEDADKLENAVTVQNGEYTVFCVCADYDGVKEMLGELFE